MHHSILLLSLTCINSTRRTTLNTITVCLNHMTTQLMLHLNQQMVETIQLSKLKILAVLEQLPWVNQSCHLFLEIHVRILSSVLKIFKMLIKQIVLRFVRLGYTKVQLMTLIYRVQLFRYMMPMSQQTKELPLLTRNIIFLVKLQKQHIIRLLIQIHQHTMINAQLVNLLKIVMVSMS